MSKKQEDLRRASPRPKGTNRGEKKLNLELAGTLCLISWSQNALLTASFSQKFAFGTTFVPAAFLPAPKAQNAMRRNTTRRNTTRRNAGVQLRYFYFDFLNHEIASLPPLSSVFFSCGKTIHCSFHDQPGSNQFQSTSC
jgi:hypothetical protein